MNDLYRPVLAGPSNPLDHAPARAGIGLRAGHLARILAERPALAWLEVHSENLFATGGSFRAAVESLRASYPLSLHGVGLSLGSAGPMPGRHLERLKQVVRDFRPAFVSDHLCWGAAGDRHSNDLLPLPFTAAARDALVDRIARVQDTLGRELLVENISSYLTFRNGTMPEWEFVAEVVARSGCGLLLDVNNLYVNSVNHGFEADTYLRAMPATAVREIHLAGFTRKQEVGVPLLIDTHDRPVAEPVWSLFAGAIARFGRLPTLIEWDQDLPPLEVLLGEAARADRVLESCPSA